jgi:hypothetical protein
MKGWPPSIRTNALTCPSTDCNTMARFGVGNRNKQAQKRHPKVPFLS